VLKLVEDARMLTRRQWLIGVGALLVLGVGMYFSFLDGYAFIDPDEGRYAEIPREMLESGDFVTPHLNYVKYLDKPPLFYWVVAASLAVLGENEVAVRVVAAIAGLLTLWLVTSLGRRSFDERTGLTAGWVFLTSLQPLVLARFPIIDMFFSLLLSSTWGAWWLGYSSQSRRRTRYWYLAAWACLGLATMTKGPVAILLTGAIVLGFACVRRSWGFLGSLAWWPGLLIFSVIVVPWHLLVGIRNPEFWHFYIVIQHIDRALGSEHARPLWWFVATLPVGMMFWGFFLFPAGVHAARCALQAGRSFGSALPVTPDEAESSDSDSRRAVQRSEAILFLVLWIGVVIGFFSLSSGKLFPYVLPAYPALALVVAWHLNSGGLEKASTGWCLALTTLLVLAMAPGLSLVVRSQDTVPVGEISGLVLAIQCGLLVAAGLLVLSIFRRRLTLLAVGLALVLIMPPAAMSVPKFVLYRKLVSLVKAIPVPLPDNVTIAEWKRYSRSLSFYTRRRIVLIEEGSELDLWATSQDADRYFLSTSAPDMLVRLAESEADLRRLADEGPLLANLRGSRWDLIRGEGFVYPIAANRKNILVANREFLLLTGLQPWPEEALGDPPLLLMPRLASPRCGPPPEAGCVSPSGGSAEEDGNSPVLR
jgi:4-amino-4-deoxy-L-arabinose transferase-like glycosyltransferase